jgi:hypothetical protein
MVVSAAVARFVRGPHTARAWSAQSRPSGTRAATRLRSAGGAQHASDDLDLYPEEGASVEERVVVWLRKAPRDAGSASRCPCSCGTIGC